MPDIVETSKANSASIVVLVEAHMQYPSEDIVAQDYGFETVIDDDKIRHHGVSVLLSGEVDKIREWVSTVGGKVWTSTNPIAGQWIQRIL